MYNSKIRTTVPLQTTWDVLNIRKHSIDPITKEIDDTEGFGAFDSLIQLFNPTCPKNFDNGGGAFDDTSNYIKERYNIANVVYDPFMRSRAHNEAVLKEAKKSLCDCCTSMSVLNVIDTPEARAKHIAVCRDVLKKNGSAFFKIWPGNKSKIPLKTKNRFQSNQDAGYYVQEIKNIFGADNVILVDDKTIKAIKKNDS